MDPSQADPSELTHQRVLCRCECVSICVCHSQFVGYSVHVCFHTEDKLIIILISSFISPSQHVQDNTSSSRANKANANLCIISQMALNPRKGEFHTTCIDEPTS